MSFSALLAVRKPDDGILQVGTGLMVRFFLFFIPRGAPNFDDVRRT